MDMGSDRDYGSKSSERKGSKESRSSKLAIQRMNAIRALDKAGKMTKEAAQRIQSHADRTGRNQDFKSRAMSAADENDKE
ncbi:MAG: hypothetical protein HY619_07315 [Thaumarchaeota archaeon]|nr:hypothetical protein [Nitrososphaerota archaeon]